MVPDHVRARHIVLRMRCAGPHPVYAVAHLAGHGMGKCHREVFLDGVRLLLDLDCALAMCLLHCIRCVLAETDLNVIIYKN